MPRSVDRCDAAHRSLAAPGALPTPLRIFCARRHTVAARLCERFSCAGSPCGTRWAAPTDAHAVATRVSAEQRVHRLDRQLGVPALDGAPSEERASAGSVPLPHTLHARSCMPRAAAGERHRCALRADISSRGVAAGISIVQRVIGGGPVWHAAVPRARAPAANGDAAPAARGPIRAVHRRRRHAAEQPARLPRPAGRRHVRAGRFARARGALQRRLLLRTRLPAHGRRLRAHGGLHWRAPRHEQPACLQPRAHAQREAAARHTRARPRRIPQRPLLWR
mmetsp:Transcript_2827/g.8768  ORF Transcript_2827/g.8768 Transcript_2827/m.8768 type:complete len:279 (+) Transcript_2827:61-897(+)